MPRVKEPAVTSLEAALSRRTREALLYEKLEGDQVRCVSCGHRCIVHDGLEGICRVRFNRGGTLYAPHGYVAGLAVDPIEKKPFFHALPGAPVLSFGMLGCDLHCPYCQNWLTSQALRDSEALEPPRDTTAEEVVSLARAKRTPVLVSTYNEPLITSEWAVQIFALARRHGIVCGYVSNGNGTPEVLAFLRPHIDLFKIDLKGFRQSNYREMGGRLEQVLDTIRALHGMGVWLEIVTLLVPGLNDGADELRDLTGFLASVSPDIPWHVTAFHRDYRMTDPADTSPRDLLRAADIGREAGLRFVYAGNLPGGVGGLENTACPGCGALLVERRGYRVLSYAVTGEGRCSSCARPIPGFWSAGPGAGGGASAGEREPMVRPQAGTGRADAGDAGERRRGGTAGGTEGAGTGAAAMPQQRDGGGRYVQVPAEMASARTG